MEKTLKNEREVLTLFWEENSGERTSGALENDRIHLVRPILKVKPAYRFGLGDQSVDPGDAPHAL